MPTSSAAGCSMRSPSSTRRKFPDGTLGGAVLMAPHGGAVLMAPHGGAVLMAPHGGAVLMAPHGGAVLMAPHGGAVLMAPHGGAVLMALSALDMFSVGIGPSSSHT